MLKVARCFAGLAAGLVAIGYLKSASAQNAIEIKSLVAIVEEVGESQVAKQAFVELGNTAAGRQLFRTLGYKPDASGLFGANLSAQERGVAIMGVPQLRESYLSKYANDPTQIQNLRAVLNTVEVNAPRTWKFQLRDGLLKPSDPLVICKVAGCKVELDAINVYKVGGSAAVAGCVGGLLDCSKNFHEFASKVLGTPLGSSPVKPLPASTAAGGQPKQ